MHLSRRHALGLMGSALALGWIGGARAAAGPAIALLGRPTRIDAGARSRGGVSGVRLAAANDGGFMATWTAGPFDDKAAYARFFSEAGAPLGPPVPLAEPDGPAGNAALDAFPLPLADGSALAFFAASSNAGPASRESDLFAQRFSASHAKSGPPVRIHRRVANTQSSLLGVERADGAVMAVWREHAHLESSYDLWGRVIAPDAAGITSERLVTAASRFYQFPSSLAALAGDDFALAYSVGGPDFAVFTRLQRLDRRGAPMGVPFTLKAGTIEEEYGEASVAALPDGGCVALYFSHGGGRLLLRARRFSARGVAGPEIAVGENPVEAFGGPQPKLAVALEPPARILVLTDVLGNRAIRLWVLDGEARSAMAPIEFVTRPTPVSAEALIRLSNGAFVASWSQGEGAGSRTYFQRFRVA